jgi:hypothetical protein
MKGPTPPRYRAQSRDMFTTYDPERSEAQVLKGAAGDLALSHRRVRWPSRPLHRLRTYDCHLLQLVSYGE